MRRFKKKGEKSSERREKVYKEGGEKEEMKEGEETLI